MCALLVALGGACPGWAHELGNVQVRAAFLRDGTFRVDLVVEPEHVPPPVGVPAPEVVTTYGRVEGLEPAVARRFGHFLRALVDSSVLAFDGWPVTPRVEGAPAETAERGAKPALRLRGPIPAGATAFTWKTALPVGTYPLVLANEGGEPVWQWLDPGVESAPFPLAAGIAPPPSRARVAWQYLVLGFTHIVPKGLDHILFVLGLFLLAVRWRPLLAQVTAFTVAHTITLGLGIAGVVGLSPRVVEPLIALSIVWIAIENVVRPELRASRVAVVFAFGLLHGLGFAGVLRDLGIPGGAFATALVAFNAGVELGQLAVIALGALLLARFRDRAWYRARVVVPASLAIAAVGLYWSVERLLA